uniref:Uncharacterized protein n=1 Tax=Arundo donax TaxID=35708 RepID=A0A0A8YEI9_ARUDO
MVPPLATCTVTGLFTYVTPDNCRANFELMNVWELPESIRINMSCLWMRPIIFIVLGASAPVTAVLDKAMNNCSSIADAIGETGDDNSST